MEAIHYANTEVKQLAKNLISRSFKTINTNNLTFMHVKVKRKAG